MDIKQIDHRLRQIAEQISALEQERSQLEVQRLQVIHHSACSSSELVLTAEQKISLFAERFEGRSDVYAIRWENKAGMRWLVPMSGAQAFALSPRLKDIRRWSMSLKIMTFDD